MSRESGEGWPSSDREWEELARYLAGESSREESERVSGLLAEDPARNALARSLERALRGLEAEPPADLDVEDALRSVSARLAGEEVSPIETARRRPQERPATGWRTSLVRIAAALTLILSGAVLWRVATRDGATPIVDSIDRTFATRTGQLDSLRLADGTNVLLGPGSRLEVPAEYGLVERVVRLAGEALFDVVHDEDRPFTVEAGTARVRDLGTTFTVRTVLGEEVHVVVTDGSVSLARASAAQTAVILRAGDRGLLDRDGRVLAERAAAADHDLAWTRGRLVLDQAPLHRVADDLRRWYGIELVLADTLLATRHLTATFTDETPRQVLDVLALALGATVEQRGDTAILHTDGPVRQP